MTRTRSSASRETPSRSLYVNGKRGYDLTEDVEWPDRKGRPYNDASYQEEMAATKKQKAGLLVAHIAIEGLLNTLTSEDLQALFGEHALVTVYRDGRVEVNTDYDE
jgi:hypothetical protein